MYNTQIIYLIVAFGVGIIVGLLFRAKALKKSEKKRLWAEKEIIFRLIPVVAQREMHT